MRTPEQQRAVDEEHVRLLGVFFCISGAFSALTGLFPLFYVGMGLLAMSVSGVDAAPDEQSVAQFIGAGFMTFGLVAFVFAQAFAGIKFLAGYWLLRRRNRVLCLIIAGIIAIGIPYSTILSVFTFVVLLRDSVRPLFDRDGDRPATVTAS